MPTNCNPVKIASQRSAPHPQQLQISEGGSGAESIELGHTGGLTYPPGTVLATDHGFFVHYGIAGDRLIGGEQGGEQSVISCSHRRRGCHEESLGAFANGKPVTCHGLIGNLTPFEILARARSEIGSPWRLMTKNCEHHVTHACGLKPKSPQIRRAAAGTVAIAALALVPGLRRALLKAAIAGV